MPRVLFVCNLNRFRSPLAAAWLTHLIAQEGVQEAWQVSSAGLRAQPGQPAHPLAVALAQGWGLDLRHHRSRVVSVPLVDRVDFIVVMETGQAEALRAEYPHKAARIHLLSRLATGEAWNVPDISGHPVEDRATGEELRELVTQAWPVLRRLAALKARAFQ